MSQVFRLSPRIPVNVQMPPPIIYLVYKNAILVSQSPCLVWAGRESKHTILLVAIEVLEKNELFYRQRGYRNELETLNNNDILKQNYGGKCIFKCICNNVNRLCRLFL